MNNRSRSTTVLLAMTMPEIAASPGAFRCFVRFEVVRLARVRTEAP